MKAFFSLVFAAALLAAGPAAAQQKGRGAQKEATQKTGTGEVRRERLSRDQRDQLRRDIDDANRDMKGRRQK